jgi:hypothetical protein
MGQWTAASQMGAKLIGVYGTTLGTFLRHAAAHVGKKVKLATLRSGDGQHGRDLREDRADAGGNTGHNCASGNGHETRHQCVFDEVLAPRVFQSVQLQNKILHG